MSTSTRLISLSACLVPEVLAFPDPSQLNSVLKRQALNETIRNKCQAWIIVYDIHVGKQVSAPMGFGFAVSGMMAKCGQCFFNAVKLTQSVQVSQPRVR